MRRLRSFIPPSKAPLALGGFLALPVFFASLMAVTLAIEKARVVEWKRGDGIARVWHQPTGYDRGEDLAARAASRHSCCVFVAWISAHFPYAFYVTSVAACIDALALTIRLHRWEVHHTARFAYGEDLIADQTTSSSLAARRVGARRGPDGVEPRPLHDRPLDRRRRHRAVPDIPPAARRTLAAQRPARA